MLIKMYYNGSLLDSLTPPHISVHSISLYMQKSCHSQAYFYTFPLDFFFLILSCPVHISTFVFSLYSSVFSFLYCNDMVCQQITVQTLKA